MKSAIKIWREKKERYKNLFRKGKVISFTKIYEAPNGFVEPYIVVMVEFDDKKRIVGELVDNRVKMRDEVVGVLRKIGEVRKSEVIEYGVKWKKL